MKPYPLQFVPELKERVWGGRALARFGFDLPQGRIGEGWMIGDHPNGTTKVQNGELAGWGLDEVRESYGPEMFGTKGMTGKTGRFPLLVKLLDCQDDLSVQVHPGDDYPGLAAGESGKTEMWYILDAKPGAKIIYGLAPGVTRPDLEKAAAEKRVMDCLREVPVSSGDAFYIPSGTVHALCAGVLVAEIQQNSDTTYRIFDYDRPGLDGKPRDLHLADSLNVIAFEGSGAERVSAEQRVEGEWTPLVRSPFFIVEKGSLTGRTELAPAADSFTVIVALEGQGTLLWAEGKLEVKPGACFLLPANLGNAALEGGMSVLRCYLP